MIIIMSNYPFIFSIFIIKLILEKNFQVFKFFSLKI